MHDNLISNFPDSRSFYFFPFGTYDTLNQIINQKNFDLNVAFTGVEDKMKLFVHEKTFFHCYFYDQEPMFPEMPRLPDFGFRERSYRKEILIVANSEKSAFKDEFLKTEHYYHDWYYFFHGFAALDWYRDFQYYNPESFQNFDKVFICCNHLISNYRNYRLHLVANLIESDIVDKGLVSFFLKDSKGSWRDTVNDSTSLLDPRAKIKAYKMLGRLKKPLIIDTDEPNGALSADVSLELLTKALWHVVTETIYFHPKLHLTEKSFKPIVAKRPFILVAAPGNLAYLKSYGFKTFDRWIDESYDQETDNYLRIEMITAELKKLCNLSRTELKQMHQEMQEVLEFNYQHFFGEFKKIIVDELVDNFCAVLTKVNHGRIPNNHSKYHIRYDLSPEKIQEVKSRLIQ